MSLSKLDALLNSYPRPRPHLPHELEQKLLDLLVQSREGDTVVTSVSQRLESWMHKQVAQHQRPGAILELGAGVLNHLPFETADKEYDIVEPEPHFYNNKDQRRKIRSFYSDINQIPADRTYGRIISIAVLEHVINLPALIADAALRLEPDGLFQAGIPSEGGVLWALSWRLGRDLPFRLKTGLDYGIVMRHEHLSQAQEILDIVRYFFRFVTIRWWPGPGLNLSLYGYIEAQDPDLERCRQWHDKSLTLP